MTTTRTKFEEDLRHLQEDLLRMGAAAERLLGQALQSLAEQDVALAQTVVSADREIDDLGVAIEAASISMIARQQPVARDLRVVGAALRMIVDLERIGDHAVHIAKVARKLARDTFYKPLVDIPWMGEKVREMLKHALAAFVSHDLDLVDRVIASDDEVDDLYHKLREELHAAMGRDPALVVQASYLLFVTHYLERIADHAVNAVERIRYIETGHLEGDAAGPGAPSA